MRSPPKGRVVVKLSYFDNVSLASEASLTKLADISLRLVPNSLSIVVFKRDFQKWVPMQCVPKFLLK
jgi:hypothetical protein